MPRDIVHVPEISEVVEEAGVPLVPVTRANGFVFVSGMPPIDPESGEFVDGDIQEQTRIAMQNVQRCLEAAGVGLEDVTKVRIYGPSEAYGLINEVYAGFFEAEPPARTFVPVPGLAIPADLEIECIASTRS